MSSRGFVCSWCVGLGLALGLVAACVGETPASDLAPPDPNRILVFFPINGTVFGRGAGGSVQDPVRTPYVCIREPFASYSNCSVSVRADGSFDFAIRAVSDDVLEFAAAEDPEGKVRGAFAFVRVPKTPSPRPAFVCCKNPGQSSGVCQQEQSVEEGAPCDTEIPGLTRTCTGDRECGADSHETLNLDMSSISVTAPNAQGNVVVSGAAIPGALVRLANRGQSSVITHGKPGRDPGIRLTMISDDSGGFRFGRVSARGGDELVLQILTLNDDRSPEASLIVPNPPLLGVDVIDVENFDALTEGEFGTIAVKVSPYGIDGYGLCPETTEQPTLCLGGGLTHSMLRFTEATIDGIATPLGVTPLEVGLPYNRGTQSDPLGGPLTIMAVVDMSTRAGTLDAAGKRLDALLSFMRKRTRDRFGLIGYGPASPVRLEPRSWSSREAGGLIDSLKAVTPAGSPDVFGAIKAAGDLLNAANAYETGRVVVLTLDNPVDTGGKTVEQAFEEAWNVVGEDPETGFRGFPVYVLPASLPVPHTYLNDIAAFTGGALYGGSACAAQLEETLSRLSADIFGSFVLLYDVRVPPNRGKSARIALELEITVRNPEDSTIETMSTTYEGALVIANGTAEQPPICP